MAKRLTHRLINNLGQCKICGSHLLQKAYIQHHRLSHIMRRRSICYECAFWEELSEYPPKYLEVINGKCFRVYPLVTNKDKSILLGGKGKTRYFMRHDGSIFQSNDIWLIGNVPDRFKSKFTVTAREITQKAFKSLLSNKRKCKARSCLDRYSCYRFDHSVEKDGAFNIPTPGWKIGDEHCRSFININDVYVDDSNVNK